jgi:hypothetical protein
MKQKSKYYKIKINQNILKENLHICKYNFTL